MKTCSKCGIQKDFCLFNKSTRSIDGLRPDCKECRSIETKLYRNKNSIKIKSYLVDYYNANKTEIKIYHKSWRDKNTENLRQYSKDVYRKNISENRIKRNIYVKNKRNSDELYKLRQNYRSRVKMFLRHSKISTSKRTNELLGCDYDRFKRHLESMFVDGMNLSNHGEWHIDHIKTLSLAKNEKDLIELCHYTNMQPLWAKDNLIKGNKIY
jgi:hypothetical protein